MKIHNVTQGSPEWHAHRAKARNASDAPAMLGCSPYMSRTELLHSIHTGIRPDVTPEQQRRFDDGHAIEAAQRPGAEAVIGEELYPVVGSEMVDGIEISASFDGLTMLEDQVYECKSLNADLRAALPMSGADENNAASLPKAYRVQMEQQLAVSGAGRVLFVAATKDGQDVRRCWYYPDSALRAEIIAGWKQFDEDLDNYQHVERKVEVVASEIPEQLPALNIELTGMVMSSNLKEFRATAMAVVEAVNTDLQTDQDFANAKAAVKYCGDVEDRIKATKLQARSQSTSIDELFRTMDEVEQAFRQTRLKLEKLVKARNDSLRAEIVSGGQNKLREHVDALNKRLGKPYMPIQDMQRFPLSIKGLKSFDSMRNAVDTELARAKVEANEVADKIEFNLNTLRELAANHAFLFADTAQLVMKANDDLTAVIRSRIADHEAAEAQKRAAEEERIRNEERARIERENAIKTALEQTATQEAAPVAPTEAVQSWSGAVPEMAKMPEKKSLFAMAHRRGPDEIAVNMGGQVFTLTDKEADALIAFLETALKKKVA